MPGSNFFRCKNVDLLADAELAIGTSFVLVIVSLSVSVVRQARLGRPRTFRVPFSPLLLALSMLCCLFPMTGPRIENSIRLLARPAIGLVIYFACRRRHSMLNAAQGVSA